VRKEKNTTVQNGKKPNAGEGRELTQERFSSLRGGEKRLGEHQIRIGVGDPRES